MRRYIDADKLWNDRPQLTGGESLGFKAGFSECMWAFSKQIKHQIDNPTADIEEVRHGYWIQTSEPKFIEGIKRIGVECSACKIRRNIPAVEYHGYYYCPECGAKMDGRREENEG